MYGIKHDLKIGDLKGESSQTTDTTTLPSKPLLWANGAINDDFRGWIPKTTQLKLALKSFVATYGGNYALLDDVIMCESSWNPNPKPNGISFGIAQFTKDTWKDFGEGDIMNPYSQLEVMVKMFRDGFAERWDCFKMLK